MSKDTGRAAQFVNVSPHFTLDTIIFMRQLFSFSLSKNMEYLDATFLCLLQGIFAFVKNHLDIERDGLLDGSTNDYCYPVRWCCICRECFFFSAECHCLSRVPRPKATRCL